VVAAVIRVVDDGIGHRRSRQGRDPGVGQEEFRPGTRGKRGAAEFFIRELGQEWSRMLVKGVIGRIGPIRRIQPQSNREFSPSSMSSQIPPASESASSSSRTFIPPR